MRIARYVMDAGALNGNAHALGNGHPAVAHELNGRATQPPSPMPIPPALGRPAGPPDLAPVDERHLDRR
jgi:hypothetical protein